MIALCSIPLLPSQAKASKYDPEVHYVVNMAISYCMHTDGGWSMRKASDWFHSIMKKDGFSTAMTDYLHNRHQPKVSKFIRHKGGCPSIAREIGGSLNTRHPQPTAPRPGDRQVLNDTPFYF